MTGGRLHPLTLLFDAWGIVRQVLFPAIVLFFFGRGEWFFFILWAVLLLPVVLGALARYFTFQYRVADGELVVKQGIVRRTQRHLPLERVQDLRVEQGLLHRLLRVATVHVETAGAQGPEASLSVLSLKEVKRLREAVFSDREGAVADPEHASEEGEELSRLTTADLALAGLTSTRLASVFVLAATGFAFLDRIQPQEPEKSAEAVAGFAQRIAERVGAMPAAITILVILGVAASVVLLAALISIVGSITLFHGFRLRLVGEDVRRTYGLLTRRASNLPRRRLQVLKIEESALRRPLRLAALRADTAGSPAERARASGNDVLMPVVRRADVPRLLSVLFPGLEHVPEMRRVSSKAISRGTLRGSIPLLVLTMVGTWQLGLPLGVLPLLLIPIVHIVSRRRYRNMGYALDAEYAWTRRGWPGRATHVVPLRNVQSVAVAQTPFDRRLGLATLHVDTAGQAYTGGGPSVANLPVAEARRLAAEIAAAAARQRYQVA